MTELAAPAASERSRVSRFVTDERVRYVAAAAALAGLYYAAAQIGYTLKFSRTALLSSKIS